MSIQMSAESCSDGADMTWCRISFQMQAVAAVTGRAHSLTVDTSGVHRHSVISTLCKSFVFSTNLRERVKKTILVGVSSSQIRKIKMAAKIQDD